MFIDHQGVGVSVRNYVSLANGANYSADAQQFFARLATQPNPPRKRAYDALITSLVSAGIWAKLDALWVFAAADQATALTNLVSSSFDATATSSPGFSVDRGVYGLAGGYVDTNFNPSTAGGHYARNDATHFARSLLDSVDASSILHDGQGTPVNLIAPRFTDGKWYARLNETAASANATIASGAHLFATSRTGAGAFDIYIDGVFVANSATASVAPANANFRICANGSTSWEGICAYSGVGSALSAGEHAALYAACEAYFTVVTPIAWESQNIYAGRLDSLADLGDGVLLTGARTGATPGEVFKSEDYGETWVSKGDQTSGEAITAFANAGSGVAYMLTGNSNLWRTDDLGETWDDLGIVSGNAAKPGFLLSYAVIVTPDGTVLVSDTAGHVHRSTDEGDNFTDIGVVSADGVYRFVVTDTRILLNGWAGATFQSTLASDGAVWTSQGVIALTPLYAISDALGGTVIQGDDDGRLFRTTDSGTTWTALGAVAGTAGTDDIALASNGFGIMSTYDGNKRNYRTRDSGATWQNIGNLPYDPTDTIEHMVPVIDGDGVTWIVGVTTLGYVVRTVAQ
jgi:hypothetical protein